MPIKHTLCRAAIVAGLALTVLPFLAVPVWQGASAHGVTATQADKQFIDGMVPHHEMAIKMADDAMIKAQHAELKAFAKQVKIDQAKEVAQMKHWRGHWFGSSDVPVMTPDQMQAMMFPAAGATYDRKWLEAMIMHHQQAIDMGAKTKLVKPELKQLAKNIQTTQRREQDKLRSWIKAWYGQKGGQPV
ncbi:MAG: DUF305 domain-containing protein [Candidatus Sericytochromatia bacterium]|nr:DUF305 domain-containing protein [Candidatus Sericytochromatia bacterium]